MQDRRAMLLEIAQLNSDLVTNCVEGIGEREAVERPLPNTNNIVFLLAHMVHARYHLCQLLGSDEDNPLEGVLANVDSIEKVEEFPKLERLMGHWFEASDRLEARLAEVGEDVLGAPAPAEFPVGDSTLIGAANFLLQHESYHLGQLGLLRRGMGHAAMSYQRRPR